MLHIILVMICFKVLTILVQLILYCCTQHFFTSYCSVSHLLYSVELQRDTIQAVSSFAQRNQIPVCLQEQMVAHLCLKYRADSEGLQQQEILDVLPKAIRSSISNFLFYSLVDKVYLFRGVSNDLLFQLVITGSFSLSPVS